MQVSLNIKDSKAEAFLNFIESLDFITLVDDEVDFELSETQKNILDHRKESFVTGNAETSTWEDVKRRARNQGE